MMRIRIPRIERRIDPVTERINAMKKLPNPFKEGDRVVRLGATWNGVVKDREYIVERVSRRDVHLIGVDATFVYFKFDFTSRAVLSLDDDLFSL